MQAEVNSQASSASQRPAERHHAAVWQARLIMLVMINIAQLWILAATVDAALARHYSVLLPLVIASGICFLITVSILRWRSVNFGELRHQRFGPISAERRWSFVLGQ